MILLVEDNESIVKGIEYSFEKNNLEIISKRNVKDATNFLNENSKKIELVILDITLPDGNGFKLFEDCIKKLNIETIFLTARDEEDNIVKGLELGAEDYMTKPFSIKELIARVNRILLRKKKVNVINIKNITFDIDKAQVYKDNEQVNLTPLELKLLSLLFSNLGKVVTRNDILDKIWDWTGNFVDDHTVTVYFKRIREKLGSDIIHTVKGIGYMIDEK